MQQDEAVYEPGRKLPLSGRADVIVCGAGPAGVAAALGAAGCGVSVILLESTAMPGGIMTSGMMPNVIDADNKGGFLQKMLRFLHESGAAGNYNSYVPEAVKHFMEDCLVKAGVRIRYNTLVCAVLKRGREVTAVIAESPAGREAFEGRIFIDCTGNGTVAALAGCRFECGDPQTGQPQAASLCALCGGVNAEDIADYWQQKGDKGKLHLLAQLEKAGCSPSYQMPTLFRLTNYEYLLMSNHEHGIFPDDADGISAALIQARREIFSQIAGLKKIAPEIANLCLLTTAAALGLREGRRIRAVYNLTTADLLAGRTQPDAVCRVTVAVDIHPSVANAKSGYGDGGVKARPYDVPLRSLIAADLDNMLLGGRCIGGDFYAHATYRVLGNAIPIGEGAGIMAGAALRKNVLPSVVKVEDFWAFGGNPHQKRG
ncbi:MAG: FAD-dependent oxidoreductase [Lentisphaerae bacterium]|nr:FAD-dependent oxidoreductase [Lentisphaerota bacterium]